jgi:hypothetical protein
MTEDELEDDEAIDYDECQLATCCDALWGRVKTLADEGYLWTDILSAMGMVVSELAQEIAERLESEEE